MTLSLADHLVLASRGVVAGVLAAAAIAKLRDRRATRAALRASGLPSGLDLTLPVVEGFTALGLLMERRSAWAAYVASALLAAFTVFLVAESARGVETPCPCFGASSAAPPPGARAIVRNLVLLALAVVATGTVDGGSWLAWLWALAVLAAWCTWTTLRGSWPSEGHDSRKLGGGQA